MAKYLVDSFEHNVELFDLQKNPLPMCDGDDCYDLPEVLDFREKVKNAEGIIMAIPVYNFNASSGAKNIVELEEECSMTKHSDFCVLQVGETATCP